MNQQFVDPRRESFFDMLKFTFCPKFTIFSFIFFITIIDVIVFLVTVIVSFTGSYGGLNPLEFLGPDPFLLLNFGAE